MTLWRDGISITVDIAFATAPLATTPTWTDVTDYVRDIPKIDRGRKSEYTKFRPGTCTIVFDNNDRRFDPDYASGAYYPNVTPMKRVRVTWATASPVASGTVFDGFILEWPQNEDRCDDSWSTVSCVDGTRLQENAVLPGSAYAAQVSDDSPVVYAPLQTDLREAVSGSALINASWASRAVFSTGTLPISEPAGMSGSPIAGFESEEIVDPPEAVEFWFDDTSMDTTTTVIATLRPNTSSLGGFPNAATVTGAATGWQALSDSSDSSYVVLPANAGDVVGGLTTFDLLPLKKLMRVRFHVRWKGDTGITAKLLDGGSPLGEIAIPEGDLASFTTQTSEWVDVELTQSRVNALTYDVRTVGVSDNGEVAEFWVEVAYAQHVFAEARSGTSGRGGSNDFMLGVIIAPAKADIPGWTLPIYNNKTDNLIYDAGPIVVNYRTNGPNHIAVIGGASTLTLMVNGTVERVLSLSTPEVSATTGNYLTVTAAANIRISHVAVYDTAPSTARFVEHYDAGRNGLEHPYAETGGERIGRALDDAGWPTATRDIDAGHIAQGAYLPAGQRLLTYLRQVERSEQGLLFADIAGQLRFIDRQTLWTQTPVIEFTDVLPTPAADASYTDVLRVQSVDTIRNIVTSSYASVGGITRRDATSITNYGEAAESLDTPTLPNGQAASNLSAYVLRTRKDPTTRFQRLRIPMRVQDGNNQADEILGLEIGDKVTITRSSLTLDVIVQGMGHTINQNQWTVTLYLSPIESNDDAPYLTLGDATLGKIGVTDSNLVPF